MAARTSVPAPPGAGDVIVATKLHIPAPRRDRVIRGALVGRLAEDRDRRLTLLAAPPGSGKTTLLADWAASPLDERPFAWLSLEDDDNDPVRFWGLVLQALRTVEPDLGSDAAAALGARGTSLTGTVLPLLINDLVSRDRRLVLALDDYHVIRERAVHESLAFCLAHQPPSLHVAIATRSDPP